MEDITRFLIIAGTLLIIIGLLYQFTPLFKLPGDIHMKKDGLSIYFPIATSIIVSIIATLVMNFFLRK